VTSHDCSSNSFLTLILGSFCQKRLVGLVLKEQQQLVGAPGVVLLRL